MQMITPRSMRSYWKRLIQVAALLKDILFVPSLENEANNPLYSFPVFHFIIARFVQRKRTTSVSDFPNRL